MLQRIQSLWLLVAGLLMASTFKVALFNGNIVREGSPAQFEKLTASSSILLAIVVAISAALALFTIFLYKNRKLQIKLVIVNLILAILSIVLFYQQTQLYLPDQSSLFILALIIPVVAVVFLILALRGITKDEKLIKSLDRLR